MKTPVLAELQDAAALCALKEEILALHEMYRARLVRYAVSLGLRAADAEDVVQETFLALFHHLKADKPRTNLAGWLFRVAHRTSLRRRAGGRIELNPAGEDLLLHYAAEGATPEEAAIFDEDHRRLQRIFKVLPEMDRLCLQLRAEGLKYREIAGVLNISLGSVYNSLERSLSRLR